jgi:hypothetical protein
MLQTNLKIYTLLRHQVLLEERKSDWSVDASSELYGIWNIFRMVKSFLRLSTRKYDTEQHGDLRNTDLIPINNKDTRSLPFKPQRRNYF